MSNELEAFIEYITVIKALSSSTIEAYQKDLTQIETAFNKELIKLGTKEVLTHFANFKNKNTINRKFSSLNSFYNFCYKKEFTDERLRLKLAKTPSSLPKYIEFNSFLEKIEKIDRDGWIGKRDYAFLFFLYATGVRVSEALNVKVEDIEGEWLKVRFAKGEKERIIPLAKEAVELILDYTSSFKKVISYHK